MRNLAILILLFIFMGCSQRSSSYNLILITVDTLRADRLGCYGYKKGDTPVLDKLAREGIMFWSVTAPVPLTLPGHASILTGLYPPSHGLRDNGDGALSLDIETLAETLKKGGWQTGAVVAAVVLDPKFGLDQGFDFYSFPRPNDRASNLFHFLEIPANEVTDQALEWIRLAKQPFFLWLHYYDPHADYCPPEPFFSRFKQEPYDGEVAFVDREIGRLVQFLEENNLTNDTLLAVTSDHGEGLQEHNEPTHGLLLYESTLRVPLILKGPGITPSSCSETSSLVDIYPTLLSLLGLEPSEDQEGQDLSSCLAGEPLAQRDIYVETLSPEKNLGWSSLQGLRRDRLKYIRAPQPELYDLTRDPQEQNNLSRQQPRLIKDMENSLSRLEAAFLPGDLKQRSTRLSQRDRDALHALGYGVGDYSSSKREKKDPKDMVFLLPLLSSSEEKLRARDLDGALKVISEILRLDPDNPVALEREIIVYRLKGDTGSALQTLEKLERVRPQGKDLIETKVELWLEKGDLAQAARAAQQGLAADKNNPVLLVQMGKILRRQGNLEAGKTFFLQALQLDQENLPARINLADYYCRHGDYAQAQNILDQALELNPQNPDAYYNRGVLARLQGSLSEASKFFKAALDLDPEHVRSRQELELIESSPNLTIQLPENPGRI